MPYSASKRDGKVTVSKKVGGHTKVVGHTTPEKKNAYLAALHIHSKDKKKKSKNEEIDGHLGQVFAVQLPYDGCSPESMVHQVDPLVGLGGSEIVPDQIHSVHADPDMANSVAQTLYEEHCAKQEMLEEKKVMTVDKIRKAIDRLEKQRKSHIDMAKENPKEASSHKEEIARLATKIDDLISKMGMIEKSKKEQDKKEDKQK